MKILKPWVQRWVYCLQTQWSVYMLWKSLSKCKTLYRWGCPLTDIHLKVILFCDNLNPLREGLAACYSWELGNLNYSPDDPVTHQTSNITCNWVTLLSCYHTVILFCITALLSWCETMRSSDPVIISGHEQRQKVILSRNIAFLMFIIESPWSCPIKSMVFCCACNMTAGESVM
jgi:hypothetical protein